MVARGVEERLLAHVDALAAAGPVVVERLLVPTLRDADAYPQRVAAAVLACSMARAPFCTEKAARCPWAGHRAKATDSVGYTVAEEVSNTILEALALRVSEELLEDCRRCEWAKACSVTVGEELVTRDTRVGLEDHALEARSQCVRARLGVDEHALGKPDQGEGFPTNPK
jgi:hypothetical protein